MRRRAKTMKRSTSTRTRVTSSTCLKPEGDTDEGDGGGPKLGERPERMFKMGSIE